MRAWLMCVPLGVLIFQRSKSRQKNREEGQADRGKVKAVAGCPRAFIGGGYTPESRHAIRLGALSEGSLARYAQGACAAQCDPARAASVPSIPGTAPR